jgi:hypothetical protein
MKSKATSIDAKQIQPTEEGDDHSWVAVNERHVVADRPRLALPALRLIQRQTDQEELAIRDHPGGAGCRLDLIVSGLSSRLTLPRAGCPQPAESSFRGARELARHVASHTLIEPLDAPVISAMSSCVRPEARRRRHSCRTSSFALARHV